VRPYRRAASRSQGADAQSRGAAVLTATRGCVPGASGSPRRDSLVRASACAGDGKCLVVIRHAPGRDRARVVSSVEACNTASSSSSETVGDQRVPAEKEPEPDPTGAPPSSPRAARRALDFPGAARRRLRTLLRLSRLYWLRAEIRFAPNEAQRLFALTIIIGASCGLAAVAFHLAIQLAEHLLIDRALAATSSMWPLWTILTPTLGGLLCGALLEYVVPNARGSGIPQVKIAFAQPGRGLRFRDAIGKFVVGALQIGSGGSLGREGPTVHICAGLASWLGRAARVSPRNLRRLLPVGAAAGIAAAFNAPIAAVTFTIEEVVGDLDKAVLSGVIIAAALAAVIERSVLGEHPVFEVPAGHGLQHASSLLLYAALGVVAGLVSLTFTESLLWLRTWFRRLRVIPSWSKPGVGGFVTGVLAVAALALLKSRGVTGGGYDTLAQALDGDVAVKAMLALCVMKIVATVSSYSSGGAGGIFAPSLFIGGMLGGAFGALDVRLFHHEPHTIGAFALVGMGAVFSGIIRAPITSVLIIIEMTNGYSLILPLMIANMTAYGLARRLRPLPIYDALLDQDGVHLRDKAIVDALEGIRLDQILTRAPLITFAPTARAGELGRGSGTQEVYPVVDQAGNMVGLIKGEDLELLEHEPDLGVLVNAADVMGPPVAVKEGDDLHTALEAMLASGVARLPVVDRAGHIVGSVDEAAIAKAYLRGHTSRQE
jgi:CIC family chloride channel protein